jgi:hypothetical protein
MIECVQLDAATDVVDQWVPKRTAWKASSTATAS